MEEKELPDSTQRLSGLSMKALDKLKQDPNFPEIKSIKDAVDHIVNNFRETDVKEYENVISTLEGKIRTLEEKLVDEKGQRENLSTKDNKLKIAETNSDAKKYVSRKKLEETQIHSRTKLEVAKMTGGKDVLVSLIKSGKVTTDKETIDELIDSITKPKFLEIEAPKDEEKEED